VEVSSITEINNGYEYQRKNPFIQILAQLVLVCAVGIIGIDPFFSMAH
jgi:hypothetical protein